MLDDERARLHRQPGMPHTMAFGQTRKVSWQSTISVGGAIYSVPSTLVDERVWARVDGGELVVLLRLLTGNSGSVANGDASRPWRWWCVPPRCSSCPARTLRYRCG
jgi:outer membrane protein assembly factor BamB